LILKAEQKYAIWDPEIAIQVGDYGSLDRDTGRFVTQGSVYDHILDSDRFRPSLGALSDQYWVTAKIKGSFGVSADPGA